VRKHLKIMRDAVKKSRRVALTVIVATILLVAGAITVISRQTAKTSNEPSHQASSPAPAQAASRNTANGTYITVKVGGQDVQVDSQTGQIKPLTPEEAQKLAAGLKQEINQSTDGLVQEQQADASVKMDLNGHFQNVLVARKNDDGTVAQGCVDNAQSAGAFFGIDPQMIENQPNSGTVGKQQTPLMPVRSANQ
jgi:hypothetical protein